MVLSKSCDKNISSAVELIGLGFVVAKSNMVENYIQCDNEKTSIDPTFDSQKSIVGVVSILDEIYSFFMVDQLYMHLQ